MCWVQKATCSVSGKYSSTFRLSCIVPIFLIGTSSSGQILVASRICQVRQDKNLSSVGEFQERNE